MENILDRFKLDGKVAIVTGAGTGIGKAVSQAFMEAGATAIFTDINLESAQAAAQEGAERSGGKSDAMKMAVHDAAEVETVFRSIVDQYGKIDILFNNAGIASIEGKTVDLDPADIAHQLDVNINGTVYCAREAAKYMIKQKSGAIINVASMSAHIYNVPQRCAYYAASKGAVISFTRSLGCELAPDGVRVNCVSPGYHMTEMAKQWTDMHPIWLERVPVGHFAQPRDLAPTIIYLASDASSYVTGAEVVVDGGYTLY
jgi:NAD(P)-dependent dehydrogenase (short-subunit alcohol dehydrogenase family)